MIPNTIPLIGYADRWSARPGETVAFKVSSRSAEPYRARLVRVISADPNPAGPGIKEEAVASDIEGSWPSQAQDAALGSYARIPGARLPAEALTVSATIWPTLPDQEGQGILSWLGEAGGLALVLDGGQGASVRVATANGVETVAVGKPMLSRAWYRVWASVDPETGAVSVGQEALRPFARVDDTGTASGQVDGAPRRDRGRHLRRGGRRKPGRRPFQRQDRTPADHAGRRAGRRYRRGLGLLARNLLPSGRSMRGRTAGTASL